MTRSSASVSPTARRAPAPSWDWKTAIRGAVILAAFTVALWIIEVVDYLLPADLDQYGLVSRDVGHLIGILTAPFLHAGFGHLAANTVPLLLLGFVAAVRSLGRFAAATAFIVLASGVGVWVLGPANTVTVGASGMIFGYFGYVVGRGAFDRRFVDIALAAIVAVAYGSILWGVFPDQPGISWQGHLFGLIGGVSAAWLLRRS